MTQKKTLTAKQQKLIAVLMSSKTVEEAIKKANVGKTTYYSWLKQPHFTEALRQSRKELIQSAFAILERSLIGAAETLQQLLRSDSEQVRRLTAVNILEQHAKRITTEEIEARLSALEAAIAEKRGRY